MSKLAFAGTMVLLCVVAAASTDSDFAGCLCWDSNTTSMCNNTDPCKRLAYREAPTIVGLSLTFAVGFFLLFFPVFFAAGRCCNCCGGRKPSYGCCCPYNRLSPRVYSRSTVSVARILALVCLFGMAGAAVMFNFAVVHSFDTLDDVRGLAQNLSVSAVQLASEASQASEKLAPFGVSPVKVNSEEVTHALNSVVRAIDSVPRATRDSAFVGYVPVGFVAIVCVLAFLGVRGFAITCFAMSMSLFAALFLILLSSIGAGAAAAVGSCEQPSRFATTASFVNSSLSIDTLMSQVSSAVNTAETDALSFLCSNMSLAALCEPAAFDCGMMNPCSRNISADYGVDVALTLVNWTVYNQAHPIRLNATHWHENMTIAECATNADCGYSLTARQLMTAFTQMLPGIHLVSPSLNPLVLRAMDGSVTDEIMDLLCGSTKHSLLWLTYALVALSAASFLSMIVLIRGAKRFAAGAPAPSTILAVPALPQQQYEDGQYRAWGAPSSVEAQPILGQVHPETFATQQYGTQQGAVNEAKIGSDVM